ncbi:acyl carrier protein [Streptomyces sp. H27-D2]|uniref:acyl carrier protein n=1 Tax=Streptomyces sp. H27-D2 TaxID=3046304 RepID=UPI002DBE3B95|nr:acyl carrier protein [Streptomyces sp. H27-D2]MEC4019137.1 acyl carrier protein [Streptomyces sp. H27-D2]
MFDQIKTLLIESFNTPAELITPSATLDDLGLDSLAAVEFALVMEKKFEVEVSDDEVIDLDRLDNIVRLLERRTAAA